MRWIVAAILAGLAVPAAAQPRDSIALATADSSFRAALADALAASGAAVVTIIDATAPSLADLTAGSRSLADREHAMATVWLIAGPTGATLVAYDRGVDRVLVRELPYKLPLSRAQAAEAARMTRTMLRALRAMPESEPVRETPEDDVDVPEPTRIREPVLAGSVALDLHLLAPGSDALPAATVAVAWRPDELGAIMSAGFAPSSDLVATAFKGDVRDTTLALVARMPLRVAPQLSVAAEAGAAVHFVHLQGTLVDGEHVDTSDIDPAVRLGADATYRLDQRFSLGFAVSADTLTARQVYEAGQDRVLEVSRVQFMAAVIAAMRIL